MLQFLLSVEICIEKTDIILTICWRKFMRGRWCVNRSDWLEKISWSLGRDSGQGKIGIQQLRTVGYPSNCCVLDTKLSCYIFWVKNRKEISTFSWLISSMGVVSLSLSRAFNSKLAALISNVAVLYWGLQNVSNFKLQILLDLSIEVGWSWSKAQDNRFGIQESVPPTVEIKMNCTEK